MKKLDRRREFGVVTGDTEGRAYHQDGVYFDAAGNVFGAPIFEPPPAESIGEEAARLAEAQRLKDEAEAKEKAEAEAKAAEEKAAADKEAADKAAGGSKKKAAPQADDQVSKQLAS